jgi:hypothetical protein
VYKYPFGGVNNNKTLSNPDWRFLMCPVFFSFFLAFSIVSYSDGLRGFDGFIFTTTLNELLIFLKKKY